MGTNPTYLKSDNGPVEMVSWNDVQEFIKKLNEKEGANKYRLPSEAEWEYAARAGTTTRYSFGDDESNLEDYAWFKKNAILSALDVGQKKPNPWGLYDIHGNVWEWVQDTWHDNYTGAPADESPWKDGYGRVVRGGSWFSEARECRSANRGYFDPGALNANLGFRLLMTVPSATVSPEMKSLDAPLVTPSSNLKTITNSIGIEFVQIPEGEFDMGSPSSESGIFGNEGPVHRVKILNAFYMGKYEVTQKQWRDVMGTNPTLLKDHKLPVGDKLPIVMISWNEAQEFIKKLNEEEGANKYRLPSEAEWEYAARAGTTTRYSFGDDGSKLGDYAWYNSNSGLTIHEAGQKKPNPWGLYDMHGNVGEWVQDRWHPDYNSGAPTDGSAWESGSGNRVFRGGSWLDGAWWDLAKRCRSAYRIYGGPDDRFSNLGFRLLRIL